VLSLLAPTATTATTASKNQDAVDVTPKKSKRVAKPAAKPAAKKKPAAKSVKVTKPVKPVKPAKAAKAATAPVTATVVPVKASKPVKAVKTVKATKPAKAKRKSPAKPTAPVGTTAPDVSTMATNTELDATEVTTVPVNPAVTTIKVSNADKLLDYLATTLNAESFIAVNLKTTTEATGIPMGSINAAIKKVMELGKVLTDGNGGYKLAA
jgi:outer membrane biosynthesis protein TonB